MARVASAWRRYVLRRQLNAEQDQPMNILAVATAIALIIAALVLARAYSTAYGAERVQPLPRCVVAFGGVRSSWAACL